MTSIRLSFSAALLATCTLVLAACSSKNNDSGNGQPQCSDGIDNNGDGLVDFPDDPSCTSVLDNTEDGAMAPQCSDGKDNDGDGKIDYPDDPGCTAPNQDDEVDDCPSGPNCPQCSNGKDDNNNGTTDYPNDPGCTSASDTMESVIDPKACGASVTIKDLPPSGNDSGTLDATSTSTVVSPCGEAASVPAVAYRVMVTTPGTLSATTNQGLTVVNTVVDLRSELCSASTSELACNDDTAGTQMSTASVDVQPGMYFVLVKGKTASDTGGYQVQVNLFKPLHAPCADASECAPDDRCRPATTGAATTCEKPVCSDGNDNDTDGKMDYPNDPGCTSAQDDTEEDDCPNGPNCPACSNGKDDDHDGHTDFPTDTSCTSASGGSEACSTETDPVLAITTGTTASTLEGMHDDETPDASCGSGTGGLDRMYTLTVPNMNSLQVDVLDANPVDLDLSLLSGNTCATPALVCNEDYLNGSLVTLTTVTAGTYIVYLDAYADYVTPLGPINIHVSGELAPGSRCEPDATLGGALTCPTANPCAGTAGSRVCTPTECSDGIDNDHDGKFDFPNDPGCTSLNGTSETDDCPNGPNCPACSNNKDDDNDGLKDYPADTACASAAGTNEACAGETDAIVTVTTGTTSADNTTAHDDRLVDAACSSTGIVHTGTLDQFFQLNIPAVNSLTLSTSGVDTILTLLPSTCGDPYVSCNDDDPNASDGGSLLTTGALAAGTFYAYVDGYFDTSTGPYTLHVSGELATGSSCEAAKTFGGALTCPTAHPCTGTAGSKTCQ